MLDKNTRRRSPIIYGPRSPFNSRSKTSASSLVQDQDIIAGILGLTNLDHVLDQEITKDDEILENKDVP